jgi:hypothetical protein
MAVSEEKKLELELQYSWDWFSYHAGQRLTAFNFFLVLMGAVVVGYTQAVDNELPALGIALGGLGALVAFAFLAMDVRNEELVRCGRAALDQVEAQMGVTIRKDDEDRKYLPDARKGLVAGLLLWPFKDEEVTHRTWLRNVIAVMGLLSLAAGVWAGFDFPGPAKGSEPSVVCHGSATAPCLVTQPPPAAH